MKAKARYMREWLLKKLNLNKMNNTNEFEHN